MKTKLDQRRRRGRPPVTQQAIVRRLRDAIVAGRLQPGERFPTRRDLTVSFKTGMGPVQAALEQLRTEGWVRAHVGDGTYVAERLPHWTRYALLLSASADDPGGAEWLFLQAYTQAAASITAEGPRHIEVVHGHRGLLEGAEVERLVEDCREHRLAGLILADHPVRLQGVKNLLVKGVHRVALTDDTAMQSCPGVDLSFSVFAEKAVAYLRGRGRRRVAVIGPGYGEARIDVLRKALECSGMSVRPHWLQYANPWAASATIPLVHLLMRLPAGDRPDALVLTDDHFAAPVTTALRELGKRVPAEVEVVSLANFPVLPETACPVRWLGFDTRAVLERCCDLVDAQRRGEVPPPTSVMEPVFEEEWRGKRKGM